MGIVMLTHRFDVSWGPHMRCPGLATLALLAGLIAGVGRSPAADPSKELRKVTDVLTPAQRSIWKKTLGRDFDLTTLGRPVFKAPELVDSGEWLNSAPFEFPILIDGTKAN